jgi:hypothetical protein
VSRAISSSQTGLPFRPNEAWLPSWATHFRSANKPNRCRSANARWDKPDRSYRRTHLTRCSGVECGLRRSAAKECFMPPAYHAQSPLSYMSRRHLHPARNRGQLPENKSLSGKLESNPILFSVAEGELRRARRASQQEKQG